MKIENTFANGIERKIKREGNATNDNLRNPKRAFSFTPNLSFLWCLKLFGFNNPN